ncbi:hypothetical protein [Paenibacillus aceti]|uniref:Uncharacterized protein n=1 Tax=Paenibacillus aceti TaxID=1820010 RepID=A0ABQ1W596_9BACL|nr:hypothetical protein [Paenibacillus aceti]GGG15733.1 hypothetical protein GCM10010913_42110 [Paenibacillus aceti]
MNFVKVLDEYEDPNVFGAPGFIVRDGIMLSRSVAVSVDHTGHGTYLMVERVKEVDDEVHVDIETGHLFFDTELPGKISVQKLASMTALEFLAVVAGIDGEAAL